MLIEYIDAYYNLSDVVEDCKEYLTLLRPKDALSLLRRIELRMDQIMEMEQADQKQRGVNALAQTVPLNVLRLKFIHHKLSRLLGLFAELGAVTDIENKAVEIFTSFMQAMESHPAVLSTIGVALNHTTQNSSQNPNRSTLSELDLANAEDMLLIAASLIVEIKVYEPTVLNPYNFSAICMLEHGLPYFPESLRIK